MGRTSGFGMGHFSPKTKRGLESFAKSKTPDGNRIKATSMGMAALGIDTRLMNHGNPRIIYGVPLVKNLQRFMTGQDVEPEYIHDISNPKKATNDIIQWWMNRWFINRVKREDVLDAIEQHKVSDFDNHGGRVKREKLDNEIHQDKIIKSFFE